MRDVIRLAATLIVLSPCLAAFSDGNDVRINIIGVLYALSLLWVVKCSSKAKRAVKNVLKSITRLNPSIDKI